MPSHLKRSYHNWNKLPGEFPNGDKIQLGLFIAFIAVWIGDSSLKGTTWLNQYIPLSIRLSLGLSCIFLSYLILKTSEKELFFINCPHNEPVQTGIYQYSRHPMYLGVIMFHFGIGFLSFSLIVWILILIVIKFYHFLINYEEKKLHEFYGIKYEIYIEIVPKWIPNIKKIINQYRLRTKLKAKDKILNQPKFKKKQYICNQEELC